MAIKKIDFSNPNWREEYLNITIEEIRVLHNKIVAAYDLYLKDKNKNIISKVGLSFSKKKKEDLLKQARMLKQHIGFDIETRSGKEYMQEKEAKAFKTFKKHTGIALSKEDYRRLVDILGDLGTTLVSQLTSDQVAEFFSRSKDKMSGNSLVELIIEVYNENDGLTKTEMLEAINDRLVEELENL